MTARRVLQILKADGWYPVRQTGSHLQLKHPTKKGLVTVPTHKGRELPPKTLKSIWQQAGL